MFHTPGCPDACWPRFLSLSVLLEVPPPAWLFSPSLSVSVSRPAAVVSLSPQPTLPAMGPKVRGQHSKAKLKGVSQSLSFLLSQFFNNSKPHKLFSLSNASVPVGMTDIWQKGATFQQKLSVTNPNWASYWDVGWDFDRQHVPAFQHVFHCLQVAVADSSSSQCSQPASAPDLISDNTYHSDHSATVTWRVG